MPSTRRRSAISSRELLADPERSAFLKDFGALAETVAFFGRINSLVLTVLKIASPGVPDFYQGTELPALTLVDPDNRRRVDFAAAAQHLEAIERLARSGAREQALCDSQAPATAP